MSRIWQFPNPVNEVAARVVAACVLASAVLILALAATVSSSWLWLTVPLALGFLARVAAGPRFSPFGLLATRVVAPRLGHERLVPGPPKRFAQAIGAALTVSAVVLLALGHPVASSVLLALLVVAAGLESLLGLCLGCRIFGVLMRIGVIPPETCEACADITLRRTAAAR